MLLRTGLVGELSEPRTDCPTTLSDLPALAPEMYAVQRAKPLNEHLEAQLLFLCVHNYPAEHAQGNLASLHHCLSLYYLLLSTAGY